MNFIQKIFQTIHPTVQVSHFKSTEVIENNKIEHDFLCFEAQNVEISSISSAKFLARRLGQKVFPVLKKSMKNEKDQQRLLQYQQSIAWVNKKAVWHPALVEHCTHQLLKKMNKAKRFKNSFLTYKEIYNDASIIAILHDIGRLSEIDVAQGSVKMKRSGLNKNHAAISFDILQKAKIKPEILLAIKYHEFADIDEASSDSLFINLEPDRQEIAKLYIRILQDMDKTANLVERSKFGIKKCAEFFDPNYIQDYDITPSYLETALSGKYLNNKGGHLLDAMVRFVTWTYSIHYCETKEILRDVLTNFFSQMYIEAEREYQNSSVQNQKKLADTLEKITKLEDYAIAEKMNLPINSKMRQKINQKISLLRH